MSSSFFSKSSASRDIIKQGITTFAKSTSNSFSATIGKGKMIKASLISDQVGTAYCSIASQVFCY